MSGAAFLQQLERLKAAERAWTAARAVLRRSLAFLPERIPGHALRGAFRAGEGWVREAHYLVAALYALKDGEHEEGRTLARALRECMQERGSASVERRFLALLDADHDQIAFRLRQTMGLVEGGSGFRPPPG